MNVSFDSNFVCQREILCVLRKFEALLQFPVPTLP